MCFSPCFNQHVHLHFQSYAPLPYPWGRIRSQTRQTGSSQEFHNNKGIEDVYTKNKLKLSAFRINLVLRSKNQLNLKKTEKL